MVGPSTMHGRHDVGVVVREHEIIQGPGTDEECQGGGDKSALTNNLDKP